MAVAPGHDAGSAPDGSEADGGAARATAAHSGEGSVLVILLTLTVLSGLIDGVCYLGLGRVFAANMTGSVVILGFAAAAACSSRRRA